MKKIETIKYEPTNKAISTEICNIFSDPANGQSLKTDHTRRVDASTHLKV